MALRFTFPRHPTRLAARHEVELALIAVNERSRADRLVERCVDHCGREAGPPGRIWFEVASASPN